LITLDTPDYSGEAVKQSEFVRWLKQHGAALEEGTNHIKVKLNGKTRFIPRHPAKELKTGLVEGVKKTARPEMKLNRNGS
jgi:mRNA interferase HicA